MRPVTTAELADRYLMQTGRRLPVTFVRGSGCLVYDDSGREYLDLVAGIAVNLLGHSHPDVVAAVTAQASTLIHTSNLYYTQPQVELAQRLVDLSFPSRVFLCNSGAEANEAAIKIARKWGTRNRDGAFEVITTTGSFHGRTLAAVTAGGQHKYSDPFKPPAISTPVGCLHCGQEYDSYLIEWRIETTHDGKQAGFWCCPTPDCGGRGFGFDILPLDPEYRDERGGWVSDEEGDEDGGRFHYRVR